MKRLLHAVGLDFFLMLEEKNMPACIRYIEGIRKMIPSFHGPNAICLFYM